MEPVSVIITACNQASELERNLPSFLSQQYEGPFQVIVVAEKGDHESEDVLKRFSSDEHLYYTLIPESSRYMSRHKLQITLGVKAAKYEWILLTEASCSPVGDNWLSLMASHCAEDMNLGLGYVALSGDTPSSVRFEHAYNAWLLFRRAEHGTAWRTNCQNLMFRRSEFISQDGFRGNLHLLRGEYDFLVNKFARKESTFTVTDRETWLVESRQTDEELKKRAVRFLSTRRELKRSFFPTLQSRCRQLLIHLTVLVLIAAIGVSAYKQLWLYTGVPVAIMLFLYSMRAIVLHKRINPLDDTLPTALLPLFEWNITWRRFRDVILYWHAEKNEFSSHKV